MVELGLVAGYLITWACRKARRVGDRLDKEVDQVLDARLDRLHDLISGKLGQDPALQKLQAEAEASGNAADRTKRRVHDAVADAMDEDPQFAAVLEEILAELAESAPGARVIASGNRSAAISGNANVSADHGSVAGLTVGDVSLGAPPPHPTEPGRSGG